jgi:hypothetical protein
VRRIHRHEARDRGSIDRGVDGRGGRRFDADERQLRRDVRIERLRRASEAPAAQPDHLGLERLDVNVLALESLLELFDPTLQCCNVVRHDASLRNDTRVCSASSRA